MLGFPAAGRNGRSRAWRTVALAAIGGAAIWCYAPALHAYFLQDDFLLLAIARLVQEPSAIFWHDHFPAGQFFRPLGIFVWWLSAALFDNAARGHYAVNLLLHLGCVLALYMLLRTLRRDAPLNPLWAAAYAVHPLTISTALWLSDRFDLLATAFSLLGVTAAIAFVRRPRPRLFVLTLVCLLAALMSKETGIVAVFAVAALFVLPNGPQPMPLRKRWLAALAALAVGGAWLALRHAILSNPQNLWLEYGPLLGIFIKGCILWTRLALEYLAADPRQNLWNDITLIAGGLLLFAALVLGLRRGGWKPEQPGIAAALLVLVLLPGLVQAPVVAPTTGELGAQVLWFNIYIFARHYHLSLAALVCVLMLATAPRRADEPGVATMRLGATALAILIAGWLPFSHAIAHDFAKRSREAIAPLAAAHAGIATLELPPRRCQIYLLDAASLWGFADNGDPMLKATTPELARLQNCLVLTERTPWGNFMRAGSIDDYRPLHVLTEHGVPIPWLNFGGFELAYLNLDDDIDARSLDGAFFLAYRDGRFVDVSAEVRSGARPVRFFNARPNQK